MALTTRHWDCERAFADLEQHIWAIVRKEAFMLSYEQMYRNQYKLVVHGKAERVYSFLRGVLRRMSLCMREDAYYGAVEIICMVSLHLDNRWCAVARLPGLSECAAAAYERPVARRWRRALFMARWAARLPKWRAVFTEAWLRPGGLGEQQLAKHFTTYAANCHPLCSPDQ